ncbi:transcriptional corepressor LEUNIG isoform X2 [Manihot esculenta]|uniref:transcriptional corepressor LEUNIG isoform X2 n=1 Tax=Manihot esculenta TaxID=3983 RepID=UPI000B5D21C3|nr:transcriptional corepressor LEUNIG isoform X2 [Manihot esculenta]
MDSGNSWDAKKMLDLYLHDYLVKRKLHDTAAIFRKEANVGEHPVVDSVDGFLHEWWTLFYDMHASRQLKHEEAKGKFPAKDGQIIQDGQILQHALQNMRPILPKLDVYHQKHGEFPFGSHYKMSGASGQPPACLLPARMLEEQQSLCYPVSNSNPNLLQLHGNKLNLSKSAATSPSFLQQQLQNQAQQLTVRSTRNINSIAEANPMDIGLLEGVPKGILARPKSCGAEVKPGYSESLNGRLSNSLMQTPSQPQQFPMLAEKQQHNLLGHSPSLTFGNLASAFPGSFANFDGQYVILPESKMNGKDAKLMVQMKQTEEHRHKHDHHMQQQLPENGRKRRKLSYSRAGDHILGCANAEVDKPANENVESFLCTGDDKNNDKGTPLGNLKRRSTACAKNDHKGFAFEEIGCLRSSKSKVLSCHFSSDGRLLASAGHDKKVFIWNMETFDFVNSSEGHSLLITDVRFRPNSTIYATSSFDRTLQIWDATKPSKSLFKLLGHADQVMALDFHPRKADLLCSCDSNDEIRLWNVNRCACTHVSKGASKQVRFQPQYGKLLATCSRNNINVIDVENDTGVQFNLKGHAKEIHSLSWDMSGKYIASVSADSARVWSLVSGGSCMYELHSNGNQFQSCTFHPGYSQLLVIGSYQSLELWNPIEGNKTLSVPAHSGLIAALADSLETETIASASHDQCVKLWK